MANWHEPNCATYKMLGQLPILMILCLPELNLLCLLIFTARGSYPNLIPPVLAALCQHRSWPRPHTLNPQDNRLGSISSPPEKATSSNNAPFRCQSMLFRGLCRVWAGAGAMRPGEPPRPHPVPSVPHSAPTKWSWPARCPIKTR